MDIQPNTARSPIGGCLFTVFTPTFNRAHTIHRVYESLAKQTLTDFEWLIVDDGSTDETADLIEHWRSEAAFPIRMYRQENSGKHFAINVGVREASGELFLILDSDDACADNALERFAAHWSDIDPSIRYEFAGVTALCSDQLGCRIGCEFASSPCDSNWLDQRYKFKIGGEKWGFTRTSIMREFPFPQDIVASCLPENVVWDAIARKYKTRFVNDVLRTYYIEAHNNSLIHSRGSMKRNAAGSRVQKLLELNENIEYLASAPATFAWAAVQYSRASFHVDVGLPGQWRALRNGWARLLWNIAWPAGYARFLVDSGLERRP